MPTVKDYRRHIRDQKKKNCPPHSKLRKSELAVLARKMGFGSTPVEKKTPAPAVKITKERQKILDKRAQAREKRAREMFERLKKKSPAERKKERQKILEKRAKERLARGFAEDKRLQDRDKRDERLVDRMDERKKIKKAIKKRKKAEKKRKKVERRRKRAEKQTKKN
jgi:hypothetical protein